MRQASTTTGAQVILPMRYGYPMSIMDKTTHRLVIPLLLGLFLGLSACSSRQAELAVGAYQDGMHSFNEGNLSEASTHFDDAIALDSTYAMGFLGQGMLHWQRNDFAGALPYLNRAIELDPDLTWAYYFRGISLISLHQSEAGLVDFEQAIAAGDLPDEDLLRAHRWHGIALLNLERYEEAVPDFTRAVELEPENPFHRLERGRIYEYLGQTQRAVEEYMVVLELSAAENEMAEEARQRLEKLEGAKEALQN